MKKLNLGHVFIFFIILVAAFTRIMPHPPNFTAIGAIALFGSVHFQKKSNGLIVPLLAMFVSDMYLGFHSNMFAVYFSFLLISGLGFYLRDNLKVKNLFFASLFSSFLFFLITNFSVWLNSMFYPKSFLGLLECYSLAIPFAFNTLLGDLFFNTILFGGFYLFQARFSSFKLDYIKYKF